VVDMDKSKKNIIMNIIIIIGMILSYLIIDVGLRFITYDNYKFYEYTKLTPSLFSLSFISIYVGIFYLLKKRYRQIFYIINLLIFNLICYSQYLHFKVLQRFYSINDLFLAKEGFNYFKYAVNKSDIKIFIVIILSLILGISVSLLSKKYNETYRDKLYFIFMILFTTLCSVSLYICAYFQLGKESLDGSSSYADSISAKSIYKDFNNPNKNMQVVGLYENLYRGIYLYIRNDSNKTKNAKIKVKQYLKDNNNDNLNSNDYTGIFEGKNIIVILMESIDSFLVNEEVMPTLNKLSNEGINFLNRYSPAFGGGETINSEFALNTGLYSNNDNNIYNLNNTYKTSLANKFKSKNYSTVSIHFNNGYYYNRTEFHKNLGYDRHYALLDMNDIDGDKYNYEYDSNLIKSDKVYNLIVRDNNYLSFITTYSAHLPYDITNEKCQNNKYNYQESDNELRCIYNLARDTDNMISLLIERLDKDNKLDDTVLVLASDHYMYGYSGLSNIKQEKNQYLLQKTPFIIWNKNIKHENIDKLVDTADILPTILNMFNIDYDSRFYVGEDVFSDNRDNYVYFDNDVYYDGKNLYDIDNKSSNQEIYTKIRNKIDFNKYLIDSNYLKVK
jgi:phosphoglycerol transferase MdoB-like AlkP superfamily enzyme